MGLANADNLATPSHPFRVYLIWRNFMLCFRYSRVLRTGGTMALSPRVVPSFLKPLLLFVALAAAIGGCAPLIAEYSAEAYKNATSLKAETLALMDKSVEPFTSRRSEVEALTTKISAAYEYAAGLPSNQASATLWQILRNPNGNLYGGFVRKWQSDKTLKPGYISEKKIDVAEMFDFIICLEANKKESKSCSSVSAAEKDKPAAAGGTR